MSVLVTHPAPDFTAQAVMEDGSFQDLKLSDYKGKYVLLFFYPLDFTFVCQIARDYDVLTGDTVALRGLFLIDKEGFVQHQVVNNLPLGRSVDEALRMVQALQYFEQNGEVCPANWKEGARTIKPTVEESKSFFSAEYSS